MAALDIKTNDSSNKINLFSGEIIDSASAKAASIATRTSLGTLIIYIIIVLAIVGTQIFLGQKKTTLEIANQQLASDIKNLSKKEELLQVLKNRVGIARDIVAKSPSSHTLTLESVISSLPASIQVTDTTIETEGVSLSVMATDSQAVSEFLNILQSKEIAIVDLEGLTLGAQGSYLVSVKLK